VTLLRTPVSSPELITLLAISKARGQLNFALTKSFIS